MFHHAQALTMAVKHTETSNKVEILEGIFEGMDSADRHVEVGGSVLEALINEYGRIGCFANATRVFEAINGPCNEACLRAIIKACVTANPEPKWQEVRTGTVHRCLLPWKHLIIQFLWPTTSHTFRLLPFYIPVI